jgi:hypothetical protein
MPELSTDDIARVFRASFATAKRWVREWALDQANPETPRVRLVPPSSGRGRTRYVVDAASLARRFPLLELSAVARAA